MKTYITYGFVIEDTKNIVTDLNGRGSINKPKKALWGSPVDAEFGWREWCESEDWWPGGEPDYFDKSFKWTLKEGSKILTINKVSDLDTIDKQGYFKHHGFFDIELDFKKILDDGYSAVELVMEDQYIGHMGISDLEMSFNSWDCQSIVVLDSETVELVA